MRGKRLMVAAARERAYALLMSDIDMVTLRNLSTEMEADLIHGLLEARGIPSIVVKPPYRSFSFALRVADTELNAAEHALEEAEAAGPEAASLAESAFEENN